MNKKYIEIEVLQSGQPRPYADHEYVEVITFTTDDWHTQEWLVENGRPLVRPMYVREEFALTVARLYCPYQDLGAPDYDQYARHLISFEAMEPTPHGNPSLGAVKEGYSDKWKIHVRAAFTD